MRNKLLIGLLAFFATLVIGVLVTPAGRNRLYNTYSYRVLKQPPQPARPCFQAKSEVQIKMSQLLALDNENVVKIIKYFDLTESHADSDNFPYLSTSYSSLVNEYVKASSALDDSDLPEDFQAAWRNHMKAWKDQADLLEKVTRSSVRPYKDGKKKFYSTNSEISATWQDVLRIARKYGADIPLGA